MMVYAFSQKAKERTLSTKGTKTDKPEVSLKFNLLGLPVGDTDSILSNAEFLLVLCLPEAEHIQAINNLDVVWHGPISDESLAKIRELKDSSHERYTYDIKVLYPGDNFFSTEHEAMVIFDLPKVCSKEEISALRMPRAFNRTMNSKKINKQKTKRNKKSLSIQAHFGYAPIRNKSQAVRNNKGQVISDIIKNSTAVPCASKHPMCKSQVVLYSVVKRLFKKHLNIDIGQNESRLNKLAFPLLCTMYGQTNAKRQGKLGKECAVEAATLYKHLLYSGSPAICVHCDTKNGRMEGYRWLMSYSFIEDVDDKLYRCAALYYARKHIDLLVLNDTL